MDFWLNSACRCYTMKKSQVEKSMEYKFSAERGFVEVGPKVCCSFQKLRMIGTQKLIREVLIHGWEGRSKRSQATGMRFWNRTREGAKRDRGVGRDGEGRSEVSRIGRKEVDFEEVKGLDRREAFRRRTGPGPKAGKSDREETGSRDRSAMSHGLVRSGDDSKQAIQGKSSNACDWEVTRESRVGRRRRAEWGLGFERLWGEG